MPIPWSSEYSVGVKEIDEQHKHYVGILNHLYKAINSQQVREEISKIFSGLIEYASVHFATEERYFKKFNYEGAEEHIAKHNEFKKEVATMQLQIADNETKVTTELVDYLENWLVGHLNSMDKKYTECFHKNGLY